MDLRNISAWSIRNPVVPIVLFVFLVFQGILAFNRMDVVQNPNIEMPMVQVTVSQPGAAPTEIENQITQRVEAAIRSVNGIEEINSTIREGSSQTMAQFELGMDVNATVNEVKAQVDQIRGSLPGGILEPQVSKLDFSAQPIAYFSISATDMTLEQLSWFVDDTVTKRLLSIPGLAQVERFGGVDREIKVILDPAKMRSLGVTASQINQALQQINLNTGGGTAEIAGARQSVRVLGNATTAAALNDISIPLGAGRFAKLSDIATIRDGNSERTSIAKVNGKETVNFAISRTKTASDVTVYDEVVKVFADLEKANPGVEFVPFSVQVDETKEMYHSTMTALIEGAILAIVVVFLFLRDWRATAISALAIPLSAIPTFWFLDLMGFNINQLVMLALSLVAGVLVDDAIVEIENIVRHMRMGKSAYQASIEAADEIGLAVVATTFSIVAVFFPVAVMPGIAGQFFRNFGYTVVISVLVSLAVARMMTPMIAAYFLKAHGEQKHGEGRFMDLYMKVLNWTMNNRLKTMAVGIAALGMTIALLAMIPKQMDPNMNVDSLRANYEMVPGTTLTQGAATAKQIEDILRKQPEVEKVLIVNRSTGSGFVSVTLKKDREATSEEFKRRITPLLAGIPDSRVTFQMEGGGGGASSGRPISVMLTGSDPALLERTAQKLVEEMKGLREVVAPRVKADLQRPEIIIRPRNDLAATMGVTTAQLSNAIRIATQGEIDQNAAKFSLSDRQVPIRVMLPESSRQDLSVIENIPVPTASGSTVPLSRIADITFGAGPTTIERYNQKRRVFIGADLAPNVVKGEAMDKINALPTLKKLPQGVSNTLSGDDKWQSEFIRDFITAIITGLFLVFAVLVLLYHRFVAPLVNMFSLLLAPLGGLLLLAIVQMPLSMPVWIGILMLIGIVGKNSILLIDYAIEEMEAGIPKRDAIVDAGHKRAQPIVMTTIAMIAGMVPTALSLSGDGSWRQPMGVTVIGGLAVSTLLTLLIVPSLFSLADGAEKRLSRWLGPKFISGGSGEEKTRGSRMHGGLPTETSPAE